MYFTLRFSVVVCILYFAFYAAFERNKNAQI